MVLNFIFQTSSSETENSCCTLQVRYQQRTCPGNIAVTINGVNFLISKYHPLLLQTPNLKLTYVNNTPYLIFPTLNASSFAKLLHWYNNKTKITLEINNNDCVSLLQIALVFNLQRVVKMCIKFMITVITANQNQLSNYGLISLKDLNILLFQISNCNFFKDDTLLRSLDHHLKRLTEVDWDQAQYLTTPPSTSQFLSPVPRPTSLRLFIGVKEDVGILSQNGGETIKKTTVRSIKNLFIFKNFYPKWKSRMSTKDHQEDKSSKQQDIAPLQNTLPPEKSTKERNSNHQNTNGPLKSQMTKHYPLALSVIRRVPRVKPITMSKTQP